MAIDRWFFGGGAEHTPESARRALYASTSGAEGVGGIGDLKVVPLAVPGQGVRVLVGSALIRSRYIGGETQTYMGTVYEAETVETTPTGSGSGRSDLVVLRVEDPYAAGSTFPEPPSGERTTAPYIHVRVISGVPAGATRLQDVPGYQNDTAVTLARIDFPASTGTVTAAMLTDLRAVALPRSEFVPLTLTIAEGQNEVLSSSAAYPVGQAFPAEQALVFVPEWASALRLVTQVGSVHYPAGSNAAGQFWVRVGDNAEAVNLPFGYYDSPNVPNRTAGNWLRGNTVEVPSTLRGKLVPFQIRANQLSSIDASERPVLSHSSSCVLELFFLEEAL